MSKRAASLPTISSPAPHSPRRAGSAPSDSIYRLQNVPSSYESPSITDAKWDLGSCSSYSEEFNSRKQSGIRDSEQQSDFANGSAINRCQYSHSVRTSFPADRPVQERPPPPNATTIATSSGSCHLAQDSTEQFNPINRSESCVSGVNRQQFEETPGECTALENPEHQGSGRVYDLLKQWSQSTKEDIIDIYNDIKNEELIRINREKEALEKQSQERIEDEGADGLSTQRKESRREKFAAKMSAAKGKILGKGAKKKEEAERLLAQKKKSGAKEMLAKLRTAGSKAWQKLKKIFP